MARLPVVFKQRPWSAPEDVSFDEGLTLAEIVDGLDLAAPSDMARVELNGELIDNVWWGRVRPKKGAILCVTVVPRGAQGLRIGLQITAIALALAASVFLGPLAGAAVGIALNLAIAFLVPPPKPELSKNSGTSSVTYAITGASNSARQWAPVPMVLGKFKVVPAYGAQPVREITGGAGGNTYWRALMIWGHGPLNITDIKIGDTPIDAYSEVEMEHRRGWSTDQIVDMGPWDPLTGIFPLASVPGQTWTTVSAAVIQGVSLAVGDTVTYNGLAANSSPTAWDQNQSRPFALWPDGSVETVVNAEFDVGVPVTRRSAEAPNELSVDLVFPYGLFKVEKHPPGKTSSHQGTVTIRYAPAGTTNWTAIPPITVRAYTQQAMYWGHRWIVDPVAGVNGYDVEITTSFIPDGSTLTCQWAILRVTRTGQGWFMPGIAATALRILASGQINGQLDNFSGVCQTMAKKWNGSAWVFAPTSQPAALFRYLLQHPLNPRRIGDDQIDLAALQTWGDTSTARGWGFNGVIDTESTLGETLRTVCRMGRASPAIRNGKRSVVVDIPRDAPRQMFTAANSRNFKYERSLEFPIHGYRTAYIYADKGYAPAEITAYADGYNATNATLVERLEWVGINNPGQSWAEGRYHLAQRTLRGEIYTLTADLDGFSCERGDWVCVAHDAISVGIAGVRITERVISGGNVVGVWLDRAVRVEAGTDYGLRVRRVSSGSTVIAAYAVSAPAGDQIYFELLDPPSADVGPRIDDLCAYGERNREVINALVRDIRPRNDLSVELTLIPLGEGVHTADSAEIPAFDPVITRITAWPAPVVVEVISDTSVAVVTPSRTLDLRVLFRLLPPGLSGFSIVVHYRPTGSSQDWAIAKIERETVADVMISGVVEGLTYDFRLWYQGDPYFTSPAAQVNGHYVAGRLSDPEALHNFQVAALSGLALLRWDSIDENDVRYGGWIEIRHSVLTTGALWSNSTSIGSLVGGDQTYTFVSLKPGTYLARVFDSGGRASTVVSASTDQLSILTYSPVGALVEHPLFTGDKFYTYVDGGILYLSSAAGIDDIENIDEIDNMDWIGNSVAEIGTYDFSTYLYIGTGTVRITSHVYAVFYNENVSFDQRTGNVDSWPDWDGDVSTYAVGDAVVYVSTSPTDPAISPTWSDWRRCDAEEFVGPWVRAQLVMRTFDAAWNIAVEELSIYAENVA